MTRLYEPQAYFERLEDLFLRNRLAFGRGIKKYWRRHPWAWLKGQARNLAASVVLYHRLMSNIPEAELRREYRRRLWRLAAARPDPNLWILYVLKCAMHYHQYRMARQMASGRTQVYNSI
jgi:hypothetical protein